MNRTILCIFLLTLIISSCKIMSADRHASEYNIYKIGEFTNLGVQLKSINRQASSFVQNSKGDEYAYIVVEGKPGHLVGYHIASREVVVDIEMSVEGAIDMVPSTDNWLYIGASNGHLFRTRPGSQEVEDLGKALDGTMEILDMIPGDNGEVFGGTYPTGKIFRYHPDDGFTDIAGQIVPGESYVRSIVFQRSSNKLYAGIGSRAHLIEIDIETGNKINILPNKYADREFIYYMGIAEGMTGGDRILAWATNPRDRETLVFNLKTGVMEQTMGSVDADAILKSKTSNEVYFTAGNKLYKKDLTTIGQNPILLADCYQAKHMRWGNDETLHILTRYGEVKTYDPLTEEMTSVKINLTPQPYSIQTLIKGADGRIWSSGYLHGGNAALDPETGKSAFYGGLGQAEGMIAMDNTIFFGVYPQSRFYSYDVTEPWDVTKNNPRFIGNIEGQDRPFATAKLKDLNKIYFGTIPGYGKLGGALIEYDLDADRLEPFINVVADQAVTSLVYHRGQVWGGTTIFGGLGAKPSEKEGKLFAWDPISKKKIFEFAPVSGTMAITGLIIGPKGKIWGLADGVLFIFDPAARKVVTTMTLFEINKNPTHIWRVGFLQLHPDGQIYGTANSNFFRINPVTMERFNLKEGVGLLTMDDEGMLYMRDSENLWRYRP